MLLENKIALVTGSTRNTGYGIAKVLAMHGAFVFIHGRREEDAVAAAEELAIEFDVADARPGNGHGFSGVSADVASQAALDAMFAHIEKIAGRLDILVNNACHLGVGGPFLETPITFFEEVMRVNSTGYFICAQNAARMMTSRGGSIVNISSITAQQAIHNRAAYIASKGAVDSMTRALALELAPLNIRVNCVVPGYIHTERWEKLTDDKRRIRRDSVPMGREAYPDDIGNAVLYFASSMSKAVTGSFLSVCAGQDIQMVPEAYEA